MNDTLLSIPAFKQLDPSQYDPGLAPFVANLQEALNDLWERAMNGGLSPDEWYTAMLDELTTSYSAAYMAGKGTPNLSAQDVANVAFYVGNQAHFLDNFRFDIQSMAQFLPAWRERAAMYAAGIAAPYWRGATNVLPLPAMPGDGSTQCMSNCRCLWEVDVLDEEAGNYDCYWTLGVADHCQTCLERAALWRPLRIRGNEVQLTLTNRTGNKEARVNLLHYKHLVGQHDQHLHGNRLSGGAHNLPVVDPAVFRPVNEIVRGSYWLGEHDEIYAVTSHLDSSIKLLRDNGIRGIFDSEQAVVAKGWIRLSQLTEHEAGIDLPALDTPSFRRLQDLALSGRWTPPHRLTLGDMKTSIYITDQDLLTGDGIQRGLRGYEIVFKELAELTLKHLVGQHNQRLHGNRGPSSASSEPDMGMVIDDLRYSRQGTTFPPGYLSRLDNGPGRSIQYHGTSTRLTSFAGANEVYLQDDPSEAVGYARGQHHMAHDQGYVLQVRRKPGKTLNINDHLEERMLDGDDPDDVIQSFLAPARSRGYDYLYFEHPTFSGEGSQRVLISLNPGKSLSIVGSTAIKETTLKHILGRHNQRLHGNRGPESIAQGVDAYDAVADVPWNKFTYSGMEAIMGQAYLITPSATPEDAKVVPGFDHFEILQKTLRSNPSHLSRFGIDHPSKPAVGIVNQDFETGLRNGLIQVRTSVAHKLTYINTGKLDSTTLRFLQRLYDKGKLALSDRIVWASGTESATDIIPTSDFLMARYVNPTTHELKEAHWSRLRHDKETWRTRAKHLAGQHNQKRHGWRYTDDSLRQMAGKWTPENASEFSAFAGRWNARQSARSQALHNPPPDPTAGRPVGVYYDSSLRRFVADRELTAQEASLSTPVEVGATLPSTWQPPVDRAASIWLNKNPAGGHSQDDVASDENLSASDYSMAMDKVAGQYKEHVADNLSQDTGLPTYLTSEFVRTWAGTSNDSNYQSLLTQKVVSEELKVPLSDWQKERFAAAEASHKEVVRQAQEDGIRITSERDKGPFYNELGRLPEAYIGNLPHSKYPNVTEATRALVRAQYQRTQKELAAAGIKEVTVYRGVALPKDKYPNLKAGDHVDLTVNALESWSLSHTIAREFAYEHGEENFYITVGMTIPASRIFSTPKTGFGCLDEMEFTVLNGNDSAMIVSLK